MLDFKEPIGDFDKKWIKVDSNLLNINNLHSEINIETVDDRKTRAMAFFDIDGTLAHLDMIHGEAIKRLFPNEDSKELEETYYKGFRLGNSFREFDRMYGIYVDGHFEWKDPEFYYKNRFLPFHAEIDEPGNEIHETAADCLFKYGKIAAEIADEIYKNNPEKFREVNIHPIFHLAKMYSRLGIPMVGFTANAKVFVEKVAKYLNLADLFIDIATDETMAGGGKEIAIYKMIQELESKGVPVPKNRLIFVGDSIRGDIGSSLVASKKDKEISGQGVLVLKDKKALIEIKKQINENLEINKLVRSINVSAFIVDEVPVDSKGNPILFSFGHYNFLEKL